MLAPSRLPSARRARSASPRAARLGAQRASRVVRGALQRDTERPVESLRAVIGNGNRAVETVPRAHEARGDRLGDVETRVRVHADLRVEALDRVRLLLRAKSRGGEREQ